MREAFADMLRCPNCRAEGRWDLEAGERDGREVREGALRCRQCGEERGVADGIVDMLRDPPEFVVREAAGLGRFAELMRNDGWDREKILQLPYVELGYWYAQAVGMQQVLDQPQTAPLLAPGKRILDIGSNTCWASATFAREGLEAVALDISTHEMQGLKTADWWFDAEDLFFERVLGVMFDMPFARDSFDLVFCCEVLHHNHRENLHRTFAELHRILKPGGRVIVINEPIRALRSPKLRPGHEVEEFEGHEHAYMRPSYVRAARGAGFSTELLGPRTIGTFNDGAWTIGAETPPGLAFRMAAAQLARRTPALRRAVLAWKTYVDGNSLYMVATKGR